MNIILDLDNTLIEGIEVPAFMKNKDGFDNVIHPRPGLPVFLKYVFDTFKHVSIWTHSITNWYNTCYIQVLQHCIPPGKHFFTVITRDNGIIQMRPDLIKNLNDFYRLFPNHNSTNTVIVDDSPHTYALNIDNAIPIKPFNVSYPENDTELYKLVQFMDEALK